MKREVYYSPLPRVSFWGKVRLLPGNFVHAWNRCHYEWIWVSHNGCNLYYCKVPRPGWHVWRAIRLFVRFEVGKLCFKVLHPGDRGYETGRRAEWKSSLESSRQS